MTEDETHGISTKSYIAHIKELNSKRLVLVNWEFFESLCGKRKIREARDKLEKRDK